MWHNLLYAGFQMFVIYPLKAPFLLIKDGQIGGSLILWIIFYWYMLWPSVKIFKFFWTGFISLIYSDWQYTKKYLKSFSIAQISGFEKLQRAIKFLRNDTFLWSSYITLSGKEKIFLTECDTWKINKINLMNSTLEEEDSSSPYVEEITQKWSTTTYAIFRPAGYPTMEIDKMDTNAFLQKLKLLPSKYQIKIKNEDKIIIQITDISEPIGFLPFSDILQASRGDEFLLGKETISREYVRMDIKPWANSTLMLLGVPWSWKTSLLLSLLITIFENSAYEKDSVSKYAYTIGTSKPDIAFMEDMEGVLRYADSAIGNIDLLKFLLSEIERRKTLFKIAQVGNILDYNNLQKDTDKLSIILAFNDEISDVMKRIEADFSKQVMQEYQRDLRVISTTARSYGIVQVVALQSGLMSIFGEQWSEFRNTFTPIAFDLRRADATRSVFGDGKSNAHLLPPWQAVFMDKTSREYKTFQVPYVTKEDIEAFRKRNQHRMKNEWKNWTEDYLQFARKTGQMKFKDAQDFGISDRQYRALCADLQTKGILIKLPNNQLAFSENIASEMIQESEEK
jgi:hypothetical protein